MWHIYFMNQAIKNTVGSVPITTYSLTAKRVGNKWILKNNNFKRNVKQDPSSPPHLITSLYNVADLKDWVAQRKTRNQANKAHKHI